MCEQYIIDQLILNGMNFHNYGCEQYKQSFKYWMYKLQEYKGFETLSEACEYFLKPGEKRVA